MVRHPRGPVSLVTSPMTGKSPAWVEKLFSPASPAPQVLCISLIASSLMSSLVPPRGNEWQASRVCPQLKQNEQLLVSMRHRSGTSFQNMWGLSQHNSFKSGLKTTVCCSLKKNNECVQYIYSLTMVYIFYILYLNISPLLLYISFYYI